MLVHLFAPTGHLALAVSTVSISLAHGMAITQEVASALFLFFLSHHPCLMSSHLAWGKGMLYQSSFQSFLILGLRARKGKFLEG